MQIYNDPYDAICAVIGSSFGEEGNYCDVSGTVTSVRTFSSLRFWKQKVVLH